jgi:tRNA (adenine22-N1)-methyltransferase
LDVGTDHGYVPVYLAQHGLAAEIYASDAAAAPLERARRNAETYGVAEKITFLRANGVPEFLRGRIDVLLLAGMGGETMAGILSRAPWLWEDGVTLILQPQTKLAELRAWLQGAGFAVPRCSVVSEGRRNYTVLTAISGKNAAGDARFC